jgi:hypothetical protein
MKTVRVQETATVRELFEQASREPVLLREPGGRAFVLVEVDRDDAETYALKDNPSFSRILERSRARARREGWLSTQQVRRELGTE